MSNKARILYLSHGGGPMPLLGDEGHKEMVSCLQNVVTKIEKPSAIIVVSAHWEERVPTITAAAKPDLIYDYYGFPPETYKIKYPSPGEPELANKVYAALEKHQVSAKLDERRGYDHGLFVPLLIMYPEADIPCIQLSLLNNLDPAQHIKMGEALRELDYDNLLIIGSGFSFHNMRAFFAPETPDIKAMNEGFESWLLETCGNASLDESERKQALIDWKKVPGATFCHPREEHLLPLHVCYGAAGRACTESFELHVLNKKASMYLW